jgi:hypothetical protein
MKEHSSAIEVMCRARVSMWQDDVTREVERGIARQWRRCSPASSPIVPRETISMQPVALVDSPYQLPQRVSLKVITSYPLACSFASSMQVVTP